MAEVHKTGGKKELKEYCSHCNLEAMDLFGICEDCPRIKGNKPLNNQMN